MEPPHRQAVCRKACVNPPKFRYAGNSDEPLSGRFSQQRLRESSRVSSPWRRGYFSGLTQAFPHRRELAGRHLKCIDKWKLASRLSLLLEQETIHFQFDTFLSAFSAIHFCAVLPKILFKLYILQFLCYGNSTMYTYMIHDYRILQFLQIDCHTGFFVVRK